MPSSWRRTNERNDRPHPGGNWYRNQARDLGKGFVRRVTDAHRRGVIDSHTAASFLDIKVDQIAPLAKSATLSEQA